MKKLDEKTVQKNRQELMRRVKKYREKIEREYLDYLENGPEPNDLARAWGLAPWYIKGGKNED
jgi:hypothetical protein